jgi:hypothetical protein
MRYSRANRCKEVRRLADWRWTMSGDNPEDGSAADSELDAVARAAECVLGA